jgi:ferric-dicitrate binding protein FerR (iron transport regulator)
MNDHSERLRYLYEQFVNNLATSEELAEFWRLMDGLKEDDPLKEIIFYEYGKRMETMSGYPMPDWDQSLHSILKAGSRYNARALPILDRKRFYWAAAVLVGIIVSAGSYFISRHYKVAGSTLTGDAAQNYTNDIAPGRNGAILTLSDGSTVNLDTAHAGMLAVQGKTTLTTDNGIIRYKKAGATGAAPLYNMVSTPRGRQYKMVLSDGSKVWLNAASSIRYPAVFEGEQRKVQITGEAYFEIEPSYSGTAKQRIPFIVQFTTPSGYSGEVNVLGTHFNVNAYADETITKATLIEGSIMLSLDNTESSVIKPGQQANIGQNGRIKVDPDVDTDAVMAWKNGFFSFSNTDMATLMRQISRWYDVEIEYAGAVPDRKFGGEISRSANASQVLKIMEESKVFFRIDGKKIIVLPER